MVAQRELHGTIILHHLAARGQRGQSDFGFLSPRVGPWDFGQAGSGYLNVSTTLRECMTKVPGMKVMLASGYYDLATPYLAADYTLNQMPLSRELRANISHSYYEGGHMMYLNQPSLEKLKTDLAKFYEETTRGQEQRTR